MDHDDALVFLLVTSMRALGMGLSVSLALDVLPGTQRQRLTIHWIAVAIWAALVTGISFFTSKLQLNVTLSLAHTASSLYLISLLILYMLKGPWVRVSASPTAPSGAGVTGQAAPGPTGKGQPRRRTGG